MLVALFALAFAQTPATTSVQVATFNVWGLPWPVTPQRKARLRAIDRWLHEGRYDIVGLQEVWRGARRHLPEHVYYPHTKHDSGLALFTLHPVDPLGFTPFKQASGPDRWKSKGVWWVRVDVPDNPCLVGIVHLQAGNSRKKAAIRAAQIETLLAALPDEPTALMGDFNFHRNLKQDVATHKLLVAGGWIEATAKLDKGTSRYSDERFDRVYVRTAKRWNLGTYRTNREVAHSDHFPVSLDLAPIIAVPSIAP